MLKKEENEIDRLVFLQRNGSGGYRSSKPVSPLPSHQLRKIESLPRVKEELVQVIADLLAKQQKARRTSARALPNRD